MFLVIKIGNNNTMQFASLKLLCEKLKWNFHYLKKKDLQFPIEYKGHYIVETLT